MPALSKHTFATGWALMVGSLANAPKKDDREVMRTYYAILSAAMGDDEFTAAVHRVLASERFWPSPAVILAAAGCGPAALSESERARELAGAEAFARLLELRIYTPRGYRLVLDDVERELGEAGVRALRAIGGPRRLADMQEKDEQWVRRDFIRAYATVLEEEGAARPLLGRGINADMQALVSQTAKALSAGRATNETRWR